jgi:hypothetical protein
MRRLRTSLSNRLRRLRRRVALTPWSVRGAAAGLVVLIAAGVIWLAADLAGPDMVPAADRPLGAEELPDAREILAARGLPVRVAGGRLMVPAHLAEQARAVLRREGLIAEDADDAFADLRGAADVWSTRSQVARREHAWKMARLSREIRDLSPVRTATVLYEPGSPRRLGAAAVAPAAAVKVTLRTGRQMTQALVEAIASLVAGSIAGMDRARVRIVDSRGRSYAASPAADEGGVIAARRAAEAFYAEKLRAAVGYVDGLVAAVHVGGPPHRCTGAVVSVPRSYYEAVRSAGGDRRELKDVIAEGSEKIRTAAARALGLDDPAAVTVDWHHDVSGRSAAGEQGIASSPGGGRSVAAVAVAAIALLAAAGGATWVARRRRRRDRGRGAGAAAPDARQAGGGEGASALGVLELASADDLLRFLESEHPQTIAVVLSQLPSEKAAAVLSGLPAERQVEVSRRVADLDKVDAETAREVGRELADRLEGFIARRSGALGGRTKLAELLHRAGLATERNVLGALGEEAPQLAESLRAQMFGFEDIASIPDWRLQPVLEDTDGAELALALRVAGQQTVRKALSCLSGPGARAVRAHMEQMGPVRLSDAEAAQERIVEALKHSEDRQYAAAPAAKSELLA